VLGGTVTLALEGAIGMLVGSRVSFAAAGDDPVWAVSRNPACVEGHKAETSQVRVHVTSCSLLFNLIEVLAFSMSKILSLI